MLNHDANTPNIYLMTSTRCGISAKQLERELGVTYKTAWRIAKVIRGELMEQTDEPLDGTVELDESYFGGKAINMHHRGGNSSADAVRLVNSPYSGWLNAKER